MMNRDFENSEFLMTMTGRVRHVVTHPEHGNMSYGFIVPDDTELDDVFVHPSEIEPWRQGFKELEKGQIVKFDLFRTPRGRLQARNVEVLRNGPKLDKFKTGPHDGVGNVNMDYVLRKAKPNEA